MPFKYWTYGAAATEVELDVLTGSHRILRADIVMDLGQPLNPALDIGQIEGAYVQVSSPPPPPPSPFHSCMHPYISSQTVLMCRRWKKRDHNDVGCRQSACIRLSKHVPVAGLLKFRPARRSIVLLQLPRLLLQRMC